MKNVKEKDLYLKKEKKNENNLQKKRNYFEQRKNSEILSSDKFNKERISYFFIKSKK